MLKFQKALFASSRLKFSPRKKLSDTLENILVGAKSSEYGG